MNANVGSSQAIKDTFRALLRTTPYDTITVGDISAAAFVSKKTFYKYFENKEAVVHALYRDDFIQPVLDIRSCLEVDKSPTVVPLMLERNYETLYSNRDIYLNLIEHYGWEKFVELRIESSQSMNRDIYARHGVTGRELEYAAYFVAAGRSHGRSALDQRRLQGKPSGDGRPVCPMDPVPLRSPGRTGSEKPFVTDRGAPRGAPLPSLPPVPRNVYPRPASRRTPASASMPRAR